MSKIVLIRPRNGKNGEHNADPNTETKTDEPAKSAEVKAGGTKCVCSVTVPYNSNCPLCGRHIRDGERAEHYPEYVWSSRVKARYLIKFLLIVAGAITLFIDYLIGFLGWSLYCVFGLILLWFIAIKPIFTRIGIASMIVRTVVFTVAFTAVWAVAMQLWSVYIFPDWTTAYLFPSLIAGGITLLLILSFAKAIEWSDVGVHILSLSLLNVLFLIFGLIGWITELKLILITLMYSVICLFGLWWFLRKKVMSGFKKRWFV